MNNQILFTPQDIINIILAICAGIMTVSGALTVIIKAIEKLKSPETVQNERIDALETEIQVIQSRLNQADKRFESDAGRLDKIDKSNIITQRALLALLSHSINGQDVDKLTKAKTDLEEYLLGKNS